MKAILPATICGRIVTLDEKFFVAARTSLTPPIIR